MAAIPAPTSGPSHDEAPAGVRAGIVGTVDAEPLADAEPPGSALGPTVARAELRGADGSANEGSGGTPEGNPSEGGSTSEGGMRSEGGGPMVGGGPTAGGGPGSGTPGGGVGAGAAPPSRASSRAPDTVTSLLTPYSSETGTPS